MKETKTSAFANGLIWFGAAVSIAEILTGTLLAPLGFWRGLAAVLLGHGIGCTLFFFAGLIGGKTEKSAMETVKLSFGQKGSLLFSSLNVLQLVGWTAVMIATAAAAANAAVDLGDWVWCLIISVLIIVWLLIGVRHLGKINLVAMTALFLLTVVLCAVVFRGKAAAVSGDSLSFGAAVELSAAMPISWLPLISDYTRTAEKPFAATMASSVAYFFTSSWMYVIGMGAAIFTGETSISSILLKAGLGAVAIGVVLLATVTTTFLDAYSAGVSSVSIWGKLKEKPAAVGICAIGTVMAIFMPITRYEDFLYLIGSVFAPMISIQIVDFFILKRNRFDQSADWRDLILWAVGFILYRVFLCISTPVGNTLPVLVITALLCLAADKLFGGKRHAERTT